MKIVSALIASALTAFTLNAEESACQGGVCAIPAAKPKALVFHHCEGWAHTQAIEAANKVFQSLADEGKIEVKFSTDYEDFKPEKLADFDVLVLNNTTGLDTKAHPWMVKAIVDFVNGGKGYTVLHGAADCFAECPELSELCGGLFAGHPWTADGTWSFKVDLPDCPINRAFKDTPKFKASDEIYQHVAPPFDPEKMTILVSLDFDDPVVAGRDGKVRPDSTCYPVSWIRTVGKGRVFYTSFGHDNRAWEDPVRRQHMLDGFFFTACSHPSCCKRQCRKSREK